MLPHRWPPEEEFEHVTVATSAEPNIEASCRKT